MSAMQLYMYTCLCTCIGLCMYNAHVYTSHTPYTCIQEWMADKRTKRQVELKVLFLLCSYIIIWSDVIGVIVATLIEAEDYRNTLVEHFTCEASGSQECRRDVFGRFDIVSKLIASFLIGLYPGIFLIYFAKRIPCRKSPTINSTVTNSASVISRNIS